MRHRRKGRKLGRNPSHQRALMKSLASALILSERDPDEELDPSEYGTPTNHKGRIVTTIAKAKEVRPYVEKCITIARRALPAIEEAEQFDSDAKRGSQQWQQWADAIAPALAARRRAMQMLGNKYAVRILFEEIAPRYQDRDGGYTRILRLAKPRLGDAGTRAILEFVGTHDRVTEKKSEKPAFDDDSTEDISADELSADDTAETTVDEATSSESPAEEPQETAESEAAEEAASDTETAAEETAEKEKE